MRKLCFLFLIPFMLYCSPERPSVKTKLSNEELNELLNQKKYSEIIYALEPYDDQMKLSEEEALFLIYAHLGKAEFKLLGFASKILNEQNSKDLDDLGFMLSCSNQAINTSENIDKKCILKRLVINVSEKENKNFSRAQILLRQYFSDVKSVRSEINFLGGVVELVSSVSRLKKLLFDLKDEDQIHVNNIVSTSELFLTDITWSLQRSLHTYNKINQWIFGLNQEKFLVENELTVSFVAETLLPDIVKNIENIQSSSDHKTKEEYVLELRSILYEN